MIIGSIKMSATQLLCRLTIIFCCIYIFFWENKVVHSGLVFLAAGFFSLLYVIFSRRVSLNSEAKMFMIIIIINFFGLLYSKGELSDSINWVIRLLIVFLIYVTLSNADVSIVSLLKWFTLLSAFFVVGVFSEFLKFSFVDNINTFLLKQDSITNNLTLRSWGFYAGFSGYNIVPAIMAMMIMFVCLSIFYHSEKKWVQLIGITLSVISFLAIIVTQKRGVFVAVLVAFLFIYWYERMHKKSIAPKLAFFLTITLFVVFVYYFLQSNTSGQFFLKRFNSSDDISTGRFDIARTLLGNWFDYFLIGNGPASVKSVYEINAHNNYIQIFYENGIFGLLFYLIFFVKNLVFAFNRMKYSKLECRKPYTVFITVSVMTQIAFLIYGVFGNPMNDLFIFLIYILFAAIPFSNRVMETFRNVNSEGNVI